MLQALLHIRFKQASRSLIQIGLIRLVVLLGLMIFFCAIIFLKSSQFDGALTVVLIWSFLLASVQISRKDKTFIQTHNKHYRAVFGTEYLIASTPIILSLLYHFQLESLAILLANILFISLLKIKLRASNRNSLIQTWIPDNCIEWKAGIRVQFFIIIPTWSIALLSSFFVGSVPLAAFLLCFYSLKFYEENEPIPVLLSYELSARKLLFFKIKQQIILLSILLLPLFALFFIFHSQYWYIIVAEYLILISLSIYALVIKYSFYREGQQASAQQIFIGIGSLAALIPFLLPLVWITSIWFYFKSIQNLKPYLNDYN